MINPINSHSHIEPKSRQVGVIRSNYAICLLLLVLLLCTSLRSADASTLLFHDEVIEKDTTWSGEINIDGVVVVSRKATLRISPGSKISFTRKDRNGDGIGDGEIRVLGAIIANGTQKNPIIFDSAEKNPALKDWSYLLLFTSPAINQLSWCEFHHAFSGLQVHFSTLIVENCIFSNNNEGLRFGRADLTVKNNSFFANDIGIRFTRMEGPVRISGNNVHDNRIGLFLVPSGQNIRDFFEPDQSGTPWNTGHLKISGNNIYHNSWYNLNLGEKQTWDLDISNNYWGSSNLKTISKTIFDRRRDMSLGRALLNPIATHRFPTTRSTTTNSLTTNQ